ncbi:MAG TPA: BlaI/MecI/CopY family transcriptional regulator [Chitinophagaceae bacterium]|nr:BlaI/MecI/CopY family transcriptional regulator [Chitinophagaceae bacterium]MCB9056021.1 BlaI/MecI/CopY family transcriptional regulator [Chitinophagales bacterium]HPG11269.1 BlaI/MecI/CopY family transcriptional regulator [Chitinophagaceae bacterium]HRX94841.1 BlaI/MecI/CopY family transcriptional regulator [Chitinophagaceae bacterium]
MKSLTKAEEQVMQVLWKLDKAFLREIVEAMPNPKPHQNTVATLLKILSEKEFVGIEVLNRHHQYYPLVSKEEYSKKSMKQLVKGYFEGSFSNVVSFLVKENNISVEELEGLLKQIKKQQNQQK